MGASASVVPDLNLHPGELYLARRPAILRTILGSCVGVTIWSPRLGAGALYHGVLPHCPSGWPYPADLSDQFRYIDYSIRYLAREFDAIGARRSELEVKLFGGADVLPVFASRRDPMTVGAMNCRIAVDVLAQEGIRVSASDLGGVRGRKIHFHTGTGAVLLHRF